MRLSRFREKPGDSRRTKFRNVILGAFTVLSLTFTGLVAPFVATSGAFAAEQCVGKYDHLRWKDGDGVSGDVYNNNSDFAKFEFNWNFPDQKISNPKLELTLPDELTASDAGEVIKLENSSGQHVATGTWLGKTLRIVPNPDFHGTHFDVKGTAEIAVKWDRNANISNGFKGRLHFSGCSGSGTLMGEYVADGPTGKDHSTFKTGTYDGLLDGKYQIRWSVGVNKSEGANGKRVLVSDTAKDGWKFQCDIPKTAPYLPVKVSMNENGSWRSDGKIRSSVGLDGGKINGITNISNLSPEDRSKVSSGYNYNINCSNDRVDIEFPYGIDQHSILIEFTMLRADKPTAEKVTNTALINGKPIEGVVKIPRSRGTGDGVLGGFTIAKIAKGLDKETEENSSYDFTYSCTHEDNLVEKLEKSVSLKSGEYVHVADVEKGYECTVSENIKEINGKKPTVHWTVVQNGISKDLDVEETKQVKFYPSAQKEKAVNVIATNVYQETPPKIFEGKFSVSKRIEVDGDPSDIGNQKTFIIDYQCGENAPSKEIRVKGNGIPVSIPEKYPEGTICVVFEDPNKQPKFQGLEHTGVPIPKRITISKDLPTLEVGLINTYTKDKGTFTLKKIVTGLPEGTAKNKTFTFDYTCGDTKGTLKVKGDGTLAKPEQDFPVGTVCKIKENTQVAKEQGYSLVSKITKGDTGLTISKDTVASFEATNTYTKDKGTFTLKKIVTGLPEGTAKNKTFTFDYTCGDTKGTLKVKGDGTLAKPEQDFPVGTVCKIKENTQVAKEQGYSLVSKITKGDTGLTISKDTVASFEATNTYTKDTPPPAPQPKEPTPVPPVTPEVPEAPKPTPPAATELPKTGATISLAAGLAAAMLIVGLGALRIRRKS